MGQENEKQPIAASGLVANYGDRVSRRDISDMIF